MQILRCASFIMDFSSLDINHTRTFTALVMDVYMLLKVDINNY